MCSPNTQEAGGRGRGAGVMAGAGKPPLHAALAGIWMGSLPGGRIYPIRPRSRNETWPCLAKMT